MVMIPQGSGGLEVGIIIIFVLSRVDKVRSPSIKRSNCSGTMQMHGGLRTGAMIDDADYSLSSTCDFESWPRIHTIVTI